MGTKKTRKLQLARETLRRLSEGDLKGVAGGGRLVPCTLARSGCPNLTYTCPDPGDLTDTLTTLC